jgi:hypothetical protein
VGWEKAQRQKGGKVVVVVVVAGVWRSLCGFISQFTTALHVDNTGICRLHPPRSRQGSILPRKCPEQHEQLNIQPVTSTPPALLSPGLYGSQTRRGKPPLPPMHRLYISRIQFKN